MKNKKLLSKYLLKVWQSERLWAIIILFSLLIWYIGGNILHLNFSLINVFITFLK